jgi:peptidoglycan-associated lipoprotein
MRKMSLLKIISLSSVFLFLASGCSSSKNPAAETAANGTSDSATTAGLNEENGFGENAGDVHVVCHPTIGKDHYYFDFDQDVIHDDDMTAIKNQIDYLATHNDTIVRVEGNTDERGSKEYNIALGYRRAKAVARALEQGGVPSKQIKIVSFGEEKPISVGHDESAWQCNRRVDLVYGDK